MKPMLYTARKQQNAYGKPIGVLVLEERIPCPPGTPGNPTTFPFPVIYQCVDGVSSAHLRDPANPGGLPAFVRAAQVLVDKGVRAVLGACGLMVVHQRELARVLPVPVLTSSLLQLPLIASTLGAESQIGVIASSRASLSAEHLRVSGAPEGRTVLGTMEGKPAFTAAVMKESGVLDFELVRDEVVDVGRDLVARHPRVQALLLECVDLPPYAAALQEAVERPVFDITTLAAWAAAGVRRNGFTGVY